MMDPRYAAMALYVNIFQIHDTRDLIQIDRGSPPLKNRDRLSARPDNLARLKRDERQPPSGGPAALVLAEELSENPDSREVGSEGIEVEAFRISGKIALREHVVACLPQRGRD